MPIYFELPPFNTSLCRSWKRFSYGFDILSVSALILLCFVQTNFPAKYCTALCFLVVLVAILLYSAASVSASYPQTINMPQHNQQPLRMIIFASDVQTIHSCSNSTASRKINLVKISLSKKDHQEVSIREYCDYWGLDFIETCRFLNLLP